MINEEAMDVIKRIKICQLNDECGLYDDCSECPYDWQETEAAEGLEIALKALEKQIVKPTKQITAVYGICPVCEHLVVPQDNFCSNCGQAIRWPEEEMTK